MRVATRCLDRGEEHLAIEGDTLVTQELVIRKMTKSGWVKTYPPPQGDYDERIEKMEEALPQEMAKVREMDDILAGVVKRVGYQSEYPDEGTHIHKEELIAWLDIEIALAEDNLKQVQTFGAGVKATATMESILATYRAVKAHIIGE